MQRPWPRGPFSLLKRWPGVLRLHRLIVCNSRHLCGTGSDIPLPGHDLKSFWDPHRTPSFCSLNICFVLSPIIVLKYSKRLLAILYSFISFPVVGWNSFQVWLIEIILSAQCLQRTSISRSLTFTVLIITHVIQFLFKCGLKMNLFNSS